jgi:hypothetical protein
MGPEYRYALARLTSPKKASTEWKFARLLSPSGSTLYTGATANHIHEVSDHHRVSLGCQSARDVSVAYRTASALADLAIRSGSVVEVLQVIRGAGRWHGWRMTISTRMPNP